MIRFSYVPPTASPIATPGVTIDATGLDDMKRLLRIINRAINCDPEAGADWFTTADQLDAVIRQLEGN